MSIYVVATLHTSIMTCVTTEALQFLWVLIDVHCSLQTRWGISTDGCFFQRTCWCRLCTDWGQCRRPLTKEGVSFLSTSPPIVIVLLWLLIQLYTQGGWTALHLSAQEGNFDVVYVLVEANAHVNQQTMVRCMSSTHGVFVLLQVMCVFGSLLVSSLTISALHSPFFAPSLHSLFFMPLSVFYYFFSILHFFLTNHFYSVPVIL